MLCLSEIVPDQESYYIFSVSYLPPGLLNLGRPPSDSLSPSKRLLSLKCSPFCHVMSSGRERRAGPVKKWIRRRDAAVRELDCGPGADRWADDLTVDQAPSKSLAERLASTCHGNGPLNRFQVDQQYVHCFCQQILTHIPPLASLEKDTNWTTPGLRSKVWFTKSKWLGQHDRCVLQFHAVFVASWALIVLRWIA
jgi:hypothetical protein